MSDLPRIPGIESQVVLAATEMGAEQKAQPEWLWHENDQYTTSYGRWMKKAPQAPYIRLDIALQEIERLRAEVESLKADIEGAAHNRFYDQADAYFEGMKDGRQQQR